LSKPIDTKSWDQTLGGSSLSRRVLQLPNVVSFLLAPIVLYLVYRELLGLDWREVWASVQGADEELFALAFALFYCTFPLRALRWKVLLGNVGYDRAGVRLMPSVLGLSRIMYLGCFANSLALARLGDAYRGYLLKTIAGVSFVVTLGDVGGQDSDILALGAPPHEIGYLDRLGVMNHHVPGESRLCRGLAGHLMPRLCRVLTRCLVREECRAHARDK
jgi:hypothetical protein